MVRNSKKIGQELNQVVKCESSLLEDKEKNPSMVIIVPNSPWTSTLGIDIRPRQQRERSNVGGLNNYIGPRKVGPRIILVTS